MLQIRVKKCYVGQAREYVCDGGTWWPLALSPTFVSSSFVIRASRMGRYARDPFVWDMSSLPKIVSKNSFKLSYLAA